MSLISQSSPRLIHCALSAFTAALLSTSVAGAAEGDVETKEEKPATEKTTAAEAPQDTAPEAPGEADESKEAPQEAPDEAGATEGATEEAAIEEGATKEAAAGETAQGAPTEEPVETDADDDSWMDLKKASEDSQPVETVVRRMPYFRTMLLVEGTVKYGGFAIAAEGTTLEDDDPASENLRAGHAGGQVSLGIMPAGKAFMMGGRLRGGSYLGERITRGNIGGEMFFGANFARNARGTDFTHVSGGFGVEFIPGENQDLLTFNITGGTVINSLAFGAGFYGGANDEYAVGMFGMHLGWGQLF